MAQPALAAAYYLLLLAGSVSLGKAVVTAASRLDARFEDEKTTGFAAVVGGAVVVAALAVDLLASGWTAFSTAGGILVFAVIVCAGVAAAVVKTFFPQTVRPLAQEHLSSAIESAEEEERRARAAQQLSRQVQVEKPVEKSAAGEEAEPKTPASIGEVIKLGDEKRVEKKQEEN